MGGSGAPVGNASLRASSCRGDSLKRPPKGFDAEHPLIDDLKRKDFIGVTRVTQKSITGAGFMDDFEALCRDGTPLVRYLCKALNVPY